MKTKAKTKTKTFHGITLKSEHTRKYCMCCLIPVMARAEELWDVEHAADEAGIDPGFLFGAILGWMLHQLEDPTGYYTALLGGPGGVVHLKHWAREVYRQWDTRISWYGALDYPTNRISVTSSKDGRFRVAMRSIKAPQFSSAYLQQVSERILANGSYLEVGDDLEIEPNFLAGWTIARSCPRISVHPLHPEQPLPLEIHFDERVIRIYQELDNLNWDSGVDIELPDQAA